MTIALGAIALGAVAGTPAEGGAPADMAGAGLAQATATGDLTTAIRLAADALAQASASGMFVVSEQVVANGCWTWYNDERMAVWGDYSFIGYVTTAGSVAIAKRHNVTGAVSTYTLHAALQVDDHCVPVISVLADGRLFVAYAANQAASLLYRISTAPGDITAWSAEGSLASTTDKLAYANPRYLPGPGKLALISRAVVDTTTRRHFYAVSHDDGGSFVGKKEFFSAGAGKIPYGISIVKGDDEIHWVMTDQHPGYGQTSLYSFYAKWHAGDNDLRWYRQDGTQITTPLPFGPADCTLIYDGSAQRCWNWDITIGRDGHPRVLFTKYPNNDGSDIRMMFSRWTGSAWTAATEVVAMGSSLYAGEPFYCGGACFDGDDADNVYASAPDPVVREMMRLRTINQGASWTKAAAITAGTAAGTIHGRPVSAKGRPAGAAVAYWSGTYNSYLSYNTAVMVAPAGFAVHDLAANAAGDAAASGDLATAIRLAADALMTAGASGALSSSISLTGAAMAEVLASGVLTTEILLTSAALAAASASATLTVTVSGLSGDAIAMASAGGALTTGITLQAAALSVSTASGDLASLPVSLSGSAAAVVVAGGALTTAIRLAADALAQVSAFGELTGGAPAGPFHYGFSLAMARAWRFDQEVARVGAL